MMARTRAACKEKLFDWAVGVGGEVAKLREQGEQPSRPAGAPAHPGRQARLVQGARALRRPRSASSSPARRRVNPDIAGCSTRSGMLDPRGLRPHRDQRRHLREPARPSLQVRHRRLAAARHRGPDRATTARCCIGPRRHARATTTSPRRRPRRSPRTAGSTPATSARSTSRLPEDHRPQEGPVQDLRRQVRRAADRSRRSSRAICPYVSQSSSTATAATSPRARHPRPGRHHRVGRGQRHGRQGRTRRSSPRPHARRWSRATSTSSTPAQPVGDDQEVRHPRPGPHRRGGRAHPQPEAAPQDRRGAVRVGDRPAVPLRCEPAYPVRRSVTLPPGSGG